MTHTQVDSHTVKRSGRRLTLLASVVAVLVIAGIIFGFRWQADRAYVGTDTAAELSWGQCLNGIGWKDPTNGVSWWAGHDVVVTGEYESEPVRVRPFRPSDPNAVPIRSVVHSSVGTIHFDAFDSATFASRTGGTIQLTRPPPDQAYTADCVTGVGNGAQQQSPKTVTWAQIAGVLGHRVPDASGEVVLATGEIHIAVDGTEVEVVPINGQAPFAINVPVGTVTLRGADAHGECGIVEMTVAAGDHVTGDLLCERP